MCIGLFLKIRLKLYSVPCGRNPACGENPESLRDGSRLRICLEFLAILKAWQMQDIIRILPGPRAWPKKFNHFRKKYDYVAERETERDSRLGFQTWPDLCLVILMVKVL